MWALEGGGGGPLPNVQPSQSELACNRAQHNLQQPPPAVPTNNSAQHHFFLPNQLPSQSEQNNSYTGPADPFMLAGLIKFHLQSAIQELLRPPAPVTKAATPSPPAQLTLEEIRKLLA